MKRFLSTIGLLAIVVPLSHGQSVEGIADTVLRGQNIIAGEYYINSGSAIPITIGPPGDEVTATIAPSLSEGDTVRVRFQSSTGKWSALRTTVFRVPYPSSSFSLTEGEYRINSGAWTALPSLPSATFSPPGFGLGDTIRARYKSTNGLWSAQRALIYRNPSPTSENKLTQLEWSVNSGTPNVLNISPPLSEDVRTILPGTLNEGDTIKVRYKSWNGLWSETRRMLYKRAYPVAQNKITHGEWFINSDPGEGNGTAVTIGFPLPEVSISPFTPPGYSDGDVIFFRFRSTNGVWGKPRGLAKEPPLQISGNRIIAGEWFLGNDPGPGNGISFSPPFDSTELTKTFTPNLTGNNPVFVRFKNSNRAWGFPHPFPQSAEHGVTGGWNLVSVSYKVLDPRKATLFPTAISSAYAFVGSQGYVARDTMQRGIGYWLKFDSTETIATRGFPITQDSVAVTSGWNLIGTVARDVPTSSILSIPPGIVSSLYYGYQQGYQSATTLEPWRGYWVKSNQPGVLVFGSGSFNPPESPSTKIQTILAGAYKLTFVDTTGASQSLYVVQDLADSLSAYVALPPTPPSGVFDVRFASGRALETMESNELPIDLSSIRFPLKVDLEGMDGSIFQLKAGNSMLTLRRGEPVRIKEGPSRFYLRFGPAEELPTEFALHQNYPNPFNPSTTVRYDLPHDAHVTIKLYNVLGQEISTLVDQIQQAGYKSISWQADRVATGVYYCRFVSGTFEQTIKLLLLK